MPRVGDLRLCKLEGCEVWQVQEYVRVLWWKEWQVVRVSWCGVMFSNPADAQHIAEFNCLEKAQLQFEKCQNQRTCESARATGAWVPC